MRLLALPAVAALLTAGACADGVEYPSLKPRPFEVAGRNSEPPSPALPPVPASARTVAQVAALVAKAEEGQRAFAAELTGARPVIALAGAASSESWIQAHQRLSGLDASRVATVAAMADLDALIVDGADAAGQPLGDGDRAAIRAAGARVMALIEGQQRVLEELGASIAPA